MSEQTKKSKFMKARLHARQKIVYSCLHQAFLPKLLFEVSTETEKQLHDRIFAALTGNAAGLGRILSETLKEDAPLWRSPLITFPRTSLVLKITLDLLMIIEQARAAHTIPNSRVKCRLAKLVPKVRDHQHLLLSYHCTQDSCPSGISP